MADNFNGNDRDDELLEKLRKVLGFSSDSDTADDVAETSNTDVTDVSEAEESEISDTDSFSLSHKDETSSSSDKKEKKNRHTQKDSDSVEKAERQAAFDTSVFDSEDDGDVSPYAYDDSIMSFSDTLDRFFEMNEQPSEKKNTGGVTQELGMQNTTEFSDADTTADFIPAKASEEERTADFIPVTKTAKADGNANDGDSDTDLEQTVTEEGSSEAEPENDPTVTAADVSDTVINSSDTVEADGTPEPEPSLPPRQDTGGEDRNSFNRTFSTGDGEDINSDIYTDAENGIMDSMQKLSEGAELSFEDDLDRIFGEGAFESEGGVSREKLKKRERKEKKEPIPDTSAENDGSLVEFTSDVQAKLFKKQYSKQYKNAKRKLTCAVVLGIPLLLFELLAAFGVSLPHFMNIQKNPAVYALILLQLFVLITACSFNHLADGVRSVLKRKILPESVAAVYCTITLIYGITVCITASPENVCPAFFSPCALCVISLLLYKFRELSREIMGFNIITSKKSKYVLEPQNIEHASKERNELFDYLPEDASAFKINKTSFVHGFVRNSRTSCSDKKILKYILPVILSVFAVAFIAMIFVKHSVSQAMSDAVSVFALVLPTALFNGFSLPFYRCSSAAYEFDSAILGEEAADSFSAASVVTLKDKEVFPSYSIKTSKFITYNSSRPDYIVFAAASVFKKLGGPLSTIFVNTAKELELTDNVTVIKTERDGIETVVNSDSVLIGSAAFMERNNLTPTYSVDDEVTESSNEKRVMYIASNGKINAKMHIKYAIDSDFAKTIKQLAKTGMCIAVMTFDPNIDNGLISAEIDIGKYPVRVVKCSSLDEMSTTQENISGEIVSKSSPKALLNALTLCKKIKSALRTNVLAMLLCVAVGSLISLLLLLTGSGSEINSLYIVAYQVFWIILSYIITALSI